MERDLYSIEGDEPDAIEKALAKAEGVMLAALARIEREEGKRVTMSDAAAIAAFIALQSMREPRILDMIRRFFTEVASMTLQMVTTTKEMFDVTTANMIANAPEQDWEDLPSYEEMRDAVREGDYKFEAGASTVVSGAFSSHEDVFRVIMRRRLSFAWGRPGESLVTSSSPVLLTGTPGQPLGLGTADHIVMPLTSRLLFIAGDGEPGVMEGQAPVGLFKSVSTQLALQSQQIYGEKETVEAVIGPLLKAEAAADGQRGEGVEPPRPVSLATAGHGIADDQT